MIENLDVSLELKELKRRLYTSKKELSKSVPGDLYREQRFDKELRYYYVTTDDGGRKARKGITKDRELIAKCARKAFLEKEVAILEKDIFCMSKLEKEFIAPSVTNVIKELPSRYSQLETQYFLKSYERIDDEIKSTGNLCFLEDWQNASYETIDYFSENRRIPVNDVQQTYVRSKSELIIARILSANSVFYHYEEILHLGDHRTVAPDFTIQCSNGKTYYWEHFGMMKNDEYKRDHDRKIQLYSDYNIGPWNNLICTYDLSDGTIDTKEVDFIIKNKLMS